MADISENKKAEEEEEKPNPTKPEAPPVHNTGAHIDLTVVPHSDGTYFSDGTGYAQ